MKAKKTMLSVRDMVYTALFTAVICVVAPFSVAIGPIPLTFTTLVVYHAAVTLGWKYGALSVALYVMLGAVGLPVFTNFEGGFNKIAGVTGGYIIGYIPCALVTGFIVDLLKGKRWAYPLGMVIGTLILYTGGTVWFMLQTNNSLVVSLTLCVTPFLIGDTVKIIVTSISAPRLREELSKLRT